MATPAKEAAALCTITLGDYVYDFDFASIGELDAGIIAFKLNVEHAAKLAPLAALVASGCGSALPGATGPNRAKDGSPTKNKIAGIACPKCDRPFTLKGKAYEKHVANCAFVKVGAPKTAAAKTEVGFIAILNLKPADMFAVKSEVDPTHIRFITGEPDAQRILGADDVIFYAHESDQWQIVCQNALPKNKLHVVKDLDGVIAVAKRLTR